MHISKKQIVLGAIILLYEFLVVVHAIVTQCCKHEIAWLVLAPNLLVSLIYSFITGDGRWASGTQLGLFLSRPRRYRFWYRRWQEEEYVGGAAWDDLPPSKPWDVFTPRGEYEAWRLKKFGLRWLISGVLLIGLFLMTLGHDLCP